MLGRNFGKVAIEVGFLAVEPWVMKVGGSYSRAVNAVAAAEMFNSVHHPPFCSHLLMAGKAADNRSMAGSIPPGSTNMGSRCYGCIFAS